MGAEVIETGCCARWGRGSLLTQMSTPTRPSGIAARAVCPITLRRSGDGVVQPVVEVGRQLFGGPVAVPLRLLGAEYLCTGAGATSPEEGVDVLEYPGCIRREFRRALAHRVERGGRNDVGPPR